MSGLFERLLLPGFSCGLIRVLMYRCFGLLGVPEVQTGTIPAIRLSEHRLGYSGLRYLEGPQPFLAAFL